MQYGKAIKMRATAKHPDLAVGTVYETAALYAARDNFQDYATFAADSEPVTATEEITTTDVRKPRNYKRRDMKAEK